METTSNQSINRASHATVWFDVEDSIVPLVNLVRGVASSTSNFIDHDVRQIIQKILI